MAKYPVTRIRYCRHVGSVRESRIVRVLKDLLPSSHKITSHSDVSVNGTDITVTYGTKPIAKFEVINEDVSSYIDSERASSIRKNLRGVSYKGLICSHGNLTRQAKKILKNIPILRLGFQTLPKSFHVFYSRINKVFKRKIANDQRLKLLKNLVLSFLIKIGFPMPMYISNKNCISSKSSSFPSVPPLSSVTICDGGSPIFPLEVEVHHKRVKKGRKRVFPFVDRKKPKIHVSFRRKMQKEEKWMMYDCEDCLCYHICYLRDMHTEATGKLKKMFQRCSDHTQIYITISIKHMLKRQTCEK